jgi:hypothetical protein
MADVTRENQRMNGTIANWFWNTGILQFGYFVTGDRVAPVRFCPEYLPAYPQLLAEVTKFILDHLDVSGIDHLIVMADSVPLGVACSLQTDLSLVYSRGRGEAAVYDLVGSYNSGHMSVLLMNWIEDQMTIEKFISNARGVGLETQAIVTLLELYPVGQLAGKPVRSVFRLVDFVQELLTAGRLSEGQAQAVVKWINER